MAEVNLKFKKYDVCKMVGMKYGRTIVDDAIIVPDIKPDIKKILDVSARTYLTNITPSQDKVHIEGVAKANVLYLPDGDVIGCAKSLSMNREFSHTIECKGATPESMVTAESEVDSVDGTLINSRKVNVRIGINFGVKVCKNEMIELPTEIETEECEVNKKPEILDILPFKARSNSTENMETIKKCYGDIELKKMPIKLSDSHFSTEGSMIIRDQYEIPAKLPQVGEILRSTVVVEPEDTLISDGKTNIKGNVKVNIMYEDQPTENSEENNNYSIRTAEFSIPYSEQFDTPNAIEDMESEPEFNVREVYTEIRDNMDGEAKVIGVEAVIGVIISGYCLKEPKVVVDAYTLNGDNLDLEFNELMPEQHIDMKTAQITEKCTAKRNATTQPEISAVCGVHVIKTSVDDIKIDENGVLVKGSILAKIIYLSGDENHPVSAIEHKCNFEHRFDMPDIAGSKVACDAKVFVNHVGYTISGSDAVDLRFIIGICIKLNKSDRVRMVKLMDRTEREENTNKNMQMYIIYFVQPGDTLWYIAKRYHTTVDKLVEDNNIANPDMISIGQKIKITV